MKLFVINGRPGCGKTTFENFCKEILEEKGYKVTISSTIDPIKRIALTLGWDGIKDAKGRKFLSDLKDALEEYCEYSYNYIKDLVLCGEYDVIFVDAREPKQIERFCEELSGISVLVQRDTEIKNFSNHADAEVNNYEYNTAILNYGSIENLKRMCEVFVNNYC